MFDLCVAAMRAGVQRDYPEQVDLYDSVALEMAYYGDLTNEFLQDRGREYDDQVDMGDRTNAMTELRAIDARKKFGIRQYDCRPGKSAVPEFLANFIAPLCGVFGLTKMLVARLSPDFADYLVGESDYAKSTRDRVREKLCELLDRNDRVMLVSHGTGCVLVYDVLWQLSHDQRFAEKYGDKKIDTWVTLGAPLGDNCIRKYLKGATGEPVSYPRNVVTWHNVSAEDDYVCHDNTLADDFKSMLEQQAVSAVQDYRVYNLAVRYGKSNPHSSIGYFIHPRMSKILVDWLRAPAIDTDPVYTI
ncbi:MAG: hypothetical protein ACR2QS_03225 [Woeseiaceae bacterium]